MLRQSSTCRHSELPKMFDNVRFFQPKMFHLQNWSNSRGLSSSAVLDFFDYSDSRWFRGWLFYRISKYWLFGRCSIWCRISEDILLMLWQCSSRISEDVQQCSFSRRWLKITEDALFIEQGRFPRQYSVCRISRMAEDVRQRSHFSRRLPKMSIRSFPRVSKDRTSK